MDALILILVLSFIGLLITSVIIWRMLVVLKNLSRSIQRMNEGDTSTPVPITSKLSILRELATKLETHREQIDHTISELSKTNIWLETLFESIDDGILTFNSRGMITSFNKGAENILGLPRADVYEQDVDQVMLLAVSNQKFTDELPSVGGARQLQILNRNQHPIDLIITRAELRLPERKTTQTALVLRDITDAEAARNLRSYFLANISHEFRTPLSALNASVELLLEEIDDLSTEEISQLLGAVHLSVTGLQTLIDNLLESSSMAAGQFQIRRRNTDIQKVVGEALRVMDPLIQRRQQSVTVRQPEALPMIKADPTRLTQVLVNLLSNASKYSPIDGKIEVDVTMETSGLYIAVADEGRGISPAESQTLFRRFTRSDDQDDPQYGIGLGLAVVKTIVEAHGGQVGVKPRPEKGSIFWFQIPTEGNLQ